MIVAMWSGPRNISTAMMRSWSERSDTAVVDEPFYAHYLHQTGLNHPGAADVIASQPTEWQSVVSSITGPVPDNRTIYYQKHITTHMLPHITLEWLAKLKNCFLIREPESVVASYSQRRDGTAASDLGYLQQYELFEHVTRKVDPDPVVVDSTTFLQDPKGQSESICRKLGIDFEPDMLSWAPGIRETDGVWHPHWYDAVSKSTGFNPYKKKALSLTKDQQAIADECRQYYDRMKEKALV